MGRILRITCAEGVPERIDLGMVRPGKIFIANRGTGEVRIGYDIVGGTGDATIAGVNYYTLPSENEYVLDIGPGVGSLVQDHQMFFMSPIGSNIVEVWIAN